MLRLKKLQIRGNLNNSNGAGEIFRIEMLEEMVPTYKEVGIIGEVRLSPNPTIHNLEQTSANDDFIK